MQDQTVATDPCEFGPWNPGIESSLPRVVLPLATVFRPENVETLLGDALELSDVSGLPLTSLVRFRAERLVIHEVLIRVMADLSVPMGQTYGDLGVNFRAMVATVLSAVTASRWDEVTHLFAKIRADAAAILDREVSAMLGEGSGATPAAPRGLRTWRSLFGTAERPTGPDIATSPEMRALRHLDAWRARAAESDDPLATATCTALQSVVSAILRRRGFLIKDKALLAMLAGTLVSNQYGSRRIGELIDPWFREAGERNGHRRLPAQSRPVIMNVKGSSASGKSTIRPYQRALVGELGLDWSDFALITPDVWRKFLLDYDGLGSARRYAGPLTGHEVEIIDGKLDQYMASKAAAGRISHLLIDRFRFDSFVVDQGTESGGQLLTRFGRQVYMQFMITPPEATVERAWKRGEQFGRYKAVEDLLAHNVEAYTGMPRLFFTWALCADKDVHFEFLDNSVQEGERPRTIAFGTNGVMTILDLKVVFDIDRYRKININARNPREVYAGAGSMEPDQNATFLRDCVRRMTTVRFADHATGRVYARCDGGRLTSLDRAAARRAEHDPDLRVALAAMGAADGALDPADGAEILCHADGRTLGSWGTGQAPSA
ncbi:hypothetical protein [uncultured Methylobacterium sp.]|uniref:hypothetical protein n=1 Tax=uncultured Methylobacterium sp. TaxID=157278 RepID=UPI0035CC05D8